MKKYVLISLFLITLFSCDKKNYTNFCGAASFTFYNENGEDLFNPNTPNYLEISELEVSCNNSNLDLQILDGVFDNINTFDIGIADTTYFKIGDLTIDTVIAKYGERGNTIFIDKLYYNGELIGEEPCRYNKIMNITVSSD